MNEQQATPHTDLIAQLMDPNVPKSEREHAAAREIERLREALRDALPVMNSYAASNPKRHFGETLQDPCGVHAWLENFWFNSGVTMDVFINGIRYVPAEAKPDGIKFYYMRDNHTFYRLPGKTIDELLNRADVMCEESPCGVLLSPYLFSGGKEVRRLKSVAHTPCCSSDYSKWIAEKEAWRKECEEDADVMRLVALNDPDSN